MSTTHNDGGPAFPAGLRQHQGSYDKTTEAKHPGMTLRDYFAAKVAAAFASDSDYSPNHYEKGLAKHAYEVADAMLAERAKPSAEGGESDG